MLNKLETNGALAVHDCVSMWQRVEDDLREL
jgi:hypothetical protein